MLAKTTLVPTPGLHVTPALLARLKELMNTAVSTGAGKNASLLHSDDTLAALYHLKSGGGLIRGRLALHASLALGLKASDALCLATSAELLHNASLVQDDLQDGDELRRGEASVWAKFSPNIAICAGDLMLSAAYAALGRIGKIHVIPDLLALVHNRLATVTGGQCADLAARNRPQTDRGEYEAIVIAKSGALLSLPLEMALTVSGESQWMNEARAGAGSFSVAYQVADDLNDVHRDAASGSLNIVTVLSNAGHSGDALHRACQLGAEHLEAASASAQRLPKGAGAVLDELCHALGGFFALRKSG